MAEAISHGINGLLFERNNVGSLTKQLLRIINEDGLLEKLRAGIPRVKTTIEEVYEIEIIYQDLIKQKAA